MVLRLAAADNRLGHLDGERLDRITATVGELVDDLDGHEDIKAIEAPSAHGASPIGALNRANRTTKRTRFLKRLAGFSVPSFASRDIASSTNRPRLFSHRDSAERLWCFGGTIRCSVGL